jgi:hypothetical protein
LTHDRIPVDPIQDGGKIVLQTKKMPHERLSNPLVVKRISLLPKGKDLITCLHDIGIEYLCKTKELSAFQGFLQGEGMDP